MNIIEVNQSYIDINSLITWLYELPQDGAVVTFIGKVRSLENQVISLTLEHYPQMTEKVLRNIIHQARDRWSINRVALVHRVGKINVNESIVFVGVSSAHRSDAFAATEFIMDVLKNEAPFWKKEQTGNGENWVEAKQSDVNALKKWY
ncbi:molybdopterin synthase catalytic subunit MoaE [Gilliamella apis]|uniref:molybdopterin synthase catalytic subunit MoaE n=1 Tax=Gilliamella apis TaxID=1970738 RepID=UPI000A34F293|nr:molybdopterin synthase catalytic subunit MoaE [Gilliamella apis]OTQ35964.1 molybdenum cofactor biosynthesis protein MoaE [Gilliamella apis]OTQ37554.1 molybdenum cofactor biosynthesis protein MoaE [Gilliamella apis]OTQ40209.1 molybdenum cofactor biosynthesis protein MoaE [Gilliamella apis]OTQ43852.1 molybdenum cofactor biosynthesis protein MoaE [Gilliamella apis]OTQ45149.1 molybdenum cofactor biosynthesis protein MoaE [Gilliamella apis]